MPTLVTITGPIASGKHTVTSLLAQRCSEQGLTVVVADVDAVARMVATPGPVGGLWFAGHRAHGALVAAWMQSEVDMVVSVGNVHSEAEQDALYGAVPPDVDQIRVLLDCPLSVTWDRAKDDERRGLSRQRAFHEEAYARFRRLSPGIPADLVFDSATCGPADIVAAILARVPRP